MDTLTYSKIILEKVSFNKQLLEKEFRKFSSQLPEPEKADLKRWCLKRFGQRFKQTMRNYMSMKRS
jgi:hypothetical protein